MNFNLLSSWLPAAQAYASNLMATLPGFASKLSSALKWVAMYLAIAGVTSFSCFLFEESIQLLSFAQFSASDTRQYGLMKDNLDYMEEINSSLRFMDKYFMWMLPPQQLGYYHYSRATDLYILTLQAEIMANDPEVYLNEYVSISFKYNSFKPGKNGLYIAESNKIKVILTKPPETKIIKVSGVVQSDPEKLGCVIIVAE